MQEFEKMPGQLESVHLQSVQIQSVQIQNEIFNDFIFLMTAYNERFSLEDNKNNIVTKWFKPNF